MDATAGMQLAGWRRVIGELYAQVRSLGPGETAWELWRSGREALYRNHPQSPVRPSLRSGFVYACFPYDPALRVLATPVAVDPRHIDGDDEVPGMTHIANLTFAVNGVPAQLEAYWLDGYAGGLLVPFADATSGHDTYGGGRYVLDTAKGADLGTDGTAVILDFNYAYSPSCAHDPRWRCPLPQRSNRLALAVRGGELHHGSTNA